MAGIVTGTPDVEVDKRETTDQRAITEQEQHLPPSNVSAFSSKLQEVSLRSFQLCEFTDS
jgi:hypothetical protein